MREFISKKGWIVSSKEGNISPSIDKTPGFGGIIVSPFVYLDKSGAEQCQLDVATMGVTDTSLQKVKITIEFLEEDEE